MTPKYYHTPSRPVSTRVRCPVCREAVYSRAGIHPQCAVKQSEPPRPKPRPPGTPDDVVPAVVIALIGTEPVAPVAAPV